MPELPEVETIVRDLAPRLTGRRFSRPRILQKDVLRRVTPQRLIRLLSGAKITEVSRRAKHAVILLGSGHRLVIQPRMTGALLIYDRRLTAEERRYTVFRASIGNRSTFVYRDVRRLGTISLLNEEAWHSYNQRIGPEPLSRQFDPSLLKDRISGSRQAIKKVVMDQHRIAGIGNVYANEALFEARIDPSRPANGLSDVEIKSLHSAVRKVLRGAIRARGTTFRDYRTGTGGTGGFQKQLKVYGRGGEPCVRCKTTLVTTHSLDGRATTFCWRCQDTKPAGSS